MDISNINGISTGDIKSFFNNTSYTISVTSQDTCRTIAEKLKALNLVDDAEQFRIYMGQKGADHFIADGEHIIPQGASYDDIITILTQK